MTAGAESWSAERRALIAHVEGILARLWNERAWCFATFDDLVRLTGPQRQVAEQAACSVAGHFKRSGPAFDIALDWFNAARSPAISDRELRQMLFASPETNHLDAFDEESIELSAQTARLLVA